jgi:predicted TIM-barrel fold metal-dependent hydrolase
LSEFAAQCWDCHAHVFAGGVIKGSHYTPPVCSIAQWQHAAAVANIARVVLVQPSVLGTDNSLLLDALRDSHGQHRGVAVIDRDVSDATLSMMHHVGVRGVRFNLVSPVGNAADVDAVVARVRPLGWHVQLWAKPQHFAWILTRMPQWHATVVLDHLGGLPLDAPLASWELAALQRIASNGAWIKASAWYRLGSDGSGDENAKRLRQLYQWFAGRMVWASDWPHTWYMESSRGAVPKYASLLAPILDAFDPLATRQILVDAPSSLYA